MGKKSLAALVGLLLAGCATIRAPIRPPATNVLLITAATGGDAFGHLPRQVQEATRRLSEHGRQSRYIPVVMDFPAIMDEEAYRRAQDDLPARLDSVITASAEKHGPISYVILAGHSTPSSTILDDVRIRGTRDDRPLRLLRSNLYDSPSSVPVEAFTPDARLLYVGCSTGRGSDPIAAVLARRYDMTYEALNHDGFASIGEAGDSLFIRGFDAPHARTSGRGYARVHDQVTGYDLLLQRGSGSWSVIDMTNNLTFDLDGEVEVPSSAPGPTREQASQDAATTLWRYRDDPARHPRFLEVASSGRAADLQDVVREYSRPGHDQYVLIDDSSAGSE